jgi:CHAT domain
MTGALPVKSEPADVRETAARVALLVVDTEAEGDAVVAHLDMPHAEHRGDADYQLWRLPEADEWEIAVVVAGAAEQQARVACEKALEALDPAVLLFIGVALPADDTSTGDVIAAERISRVYRPRRRSTRRPLTRTASDHDLLRGAARAFDEGSWTEGVRLELEQVGDASFGHVITGHLPRRPGLQPRSVKDAFADAAALVPGRWGHVPALYADDNLPALAFCAVRGKLDGDDASRAAAADHACTLALAVLASAPVAAADMLESVLDDGVAEHMQSDLDSLAVERREGFIQRRFITGARHVTQAPQREDNSRKERLNRERVGALMQTAGSSKRAVPPADVEISIELHDGRLDFYLSVGDERPGLTPYRHKRVGSKPLGGQFGGSPEKYRESLMRRIREIAADPPPAGDDRLERIGSHIFDDLFPDLLKVEYANFRDKIETLWITSDEPWIPWELVRPYSADYSDDFLAAKFHLTRWHGEIEPKPRFDISHIAWIEAGTVENEAVLESAAGECSHLAQLAREHSVRDLGSREANRETIRQLFSQEQDIQLWHVAAHGRLGVQDPARNAIVLHGGRWEADDLTGDDKTAIGKARPLVFFNACLVAQQDFTFGELAGWPAAWLKSRCGAFLGPQWSLDSDLAAVFSRAFYDALAEHETLGIAASRARAAVRKAAPTDPAWLSYAVYGNPNAVVEFIGAGEEGSA